jgi:CRISPR-associated protein (Cas_Cas02710)
MEIISSNLFTFDESTWLWLDRYGIIVGDLLMTFTFLATIYGFICRNKLRNWFKRNQFPSIGGQLEHSHWQGIIFTVSRKEVPLWVIKQINPRAIGLLSSESSRNAAQEIRVFAQQMGTLIIEEEVINDPDDPAEVNRKAKKIMHELKDKGLDEMAMDITGGKTPMSLGAFMAAEEMGVDSIYVTTEYKDNKPDITTAKIKAISQVA